MKTVRMSVTRKLLRETETSLLFVCTNVSDAIRHLHPAPVERGSRRLEATERLLCKEFPRIEAVSEHETKTVSCSTKTKQPRMGLHS